MTLACCIFATYMTAKQIIRFLENDDSTAIHFRRFNLSPKDTYPTFSICLTGSGFYWNKPHPIFQKTELSPIMFGRMLKGQDAFSYKYNYTVMLYNKISVDSGDYPNMDIGQFSLKISEILTGLQYATENEEANIYYGSGEKGTSAGTSGPTMPPA